MHKVIVLLYLLFSNNKLAMLLNLVYKFDCKFIKENKLGSLMVFSPPAGVTGATQSLFRHRPLEGGQVHTTKANLVCKTDLRSNQMSFNGMLFF